MKSIGLFEAKAKFSAVCEKVVLENEGLVITKRGLPFVKIIPILDNPKQTGVWDLAQLFWEKNTFPSGDLVVPERKKEKLRNFLK